MSAELAERSTLDVDGVPFVVTVQHIRERQSASYKVVVILHAANGAEGYIGELHVNRDTLARADLAEIAVRIMERIIRGDLPPQVGEWSASS